MTFLRTLTVSDVRVEIEAEREELEPDDASLAYDPSVVEGFKEMLEEHGVWGWCQVVVRVVWHDLYGDAFLGGCSYKDEEDFIKNSGYYEQMLEDALGELNAKVRKHLEKADAMRRELEVDPTLTQDEAFEKRFGKTMEQASQEAIDELRRKGK